MSFSFSRFAVTGALAMLATSGWAADSVPPPPSATDAMPAAATAGTPLAAPGFTPAPAPARPSAPAPAIVASLPEGPCVPPAPRASLTLAQARLDALRCNSDIIAARRGEEASQADIQVASQRPNPVLSLSVQNVNPHLGVGAGGPRSKTVDSIARVDQLIETANKGGLRKDVARAANVAAGEQLQAVLTQQTSAVEQAFYEAAVSQERVAVLRQVLDIYGRTEQANQARLKAGDVSRADVTKLQLDGLRAQQDLRDALADHAKDKAALAQQIGIPGTLQDNPLVSDWPALDAAVQPFDPERLQRRPDVTAAEARLRAAASARDLARAGRVPDVTVGAQAEHWPSSEANPNGSGNSFGVFISVPLFVRHSFGGEARRAEVDYYAALDERNRVLLAAQNEVERALSQLEAARQSLRQMREAVLPAAESVAGNAEFAYSKGATGVLDLLDARRALRQTRLDAANAQGEYAKAVSAYVAALQSSSTPASQSGSAGSNSPSSLPQVRPDAQRQ